MTEVLKPLRVAVIGLGPMGMHHVRAYRRLPQFDLVAVVDTHPDRAQAAAREAGCTALSNAGDLSGRVDAVTVATPPATHGAVAGELIKAGVHCLIEKPLAMTDAECRVLAKGGPAVVRVGHIERFNPAFEALQKAAPGVALSIAARRLNPPGRTVPIDVVHDLMVHDIDLALLLKGTAPVQVEARRLGPEHAVARLSFADGSFCTLEASRAAMSPVREMSVASAKGFYELDFHKRTLTPKAEALSTADALEQQLLDFLAACRGEKSRGATAAEAALALTVARQIADLIGGGR